MVQHLALIVPLDLDVELSALQFNAGNSARYRSVADGFAHREAKNVAGLDYRGQRRRICFTLLIAAVLPEQIAPSWVLRAAILVHLAEL
eukprot:3839833-Pyramimonas_sp.AAC.1